MQDLIGRTLGHYRIVDKIGAGGMGEVYRAHDDHLGRDVAIKTLLGSVAQDEQRMLRFEREAKLLASLSHQNIATLHGLEEHEGQRYLVMELVEGETLADRIVRGPVSIDDTLDYARQIAEGLEAAHEKGIIHRDLKPANIMLSDEGGIKILDFGLAKGFEPSDSSPSTPESIANSPTLTAAVTGTGVLLGTAAYMSPEQARGKQADKRADVWAFGCVLYEMLTGIKAFQGDDASQTMAAILRDEPDWDALPPATPAHIRWLLTRCLVKKPHDRLHDIADARIAIEKPVDENASSDQNVALPSPRNRWLLGLAWLLTASVPAIVIALLLGAWQDQPAQPVTRAQIGIEDDKTVGSSGGVFPRSFGVAALSVATFALSPDGRFLVYSAGDEREWSSKLYIRALDESASSVLEGAEKARSPFFSPDGEWIGFFAEGELWRIPSGGGPVQTICRPKIQPFGASWGPDDTIFFDTKADEIYRVDAEGGEPTAVTTLAEDESAHTHPFVLPDGETLLYTVRSADFGDWTSAKIVAQSLETGERTTLVTGGSDGRFTASGHLIFMREGKLMAAGFDPARRTLTGPPVVVQDGVRHAVNTGGINTESFSGQYAVSDSGTLAFLPGSTWPDEECEPVWVDRDGNEEALNIEAGNYQGLRISPNGTRIVVPKKEGRQRPLWIFDITRETLSRLTFNGVRTRYPVWTPDGSRVAYQNLEPTSRLPENPGLIDWVTTDGQGDVEQLTAVPGVPCSWSPEGDGLAFSNLKEDLDIWLKPPDGDAYALIETGYNEGGPAISPDGRWLAFHADYTGGFEVYVTSFPEPGRTTQVSVDGGGTPVWSPDGSELFFMEFYPDEVMKAVDVTIGSDFTAGPQRELFTGNYFEGRYCRGFDVSPDDQRFLMCRVIAREPERIGEIHLILNWFEELNRLATPD